ncbi:hypothetical protein AB0C07_08540 [Actinoplanes missouriensis]|uniref:hypothetical protein n=1 Tax=Actinoplanes missouriensis TaxID=1866 RepID=UPI0033FA1323
MSEVQPQNGSPGRNARQKSLLSVGGISLAVVGIGFVVDLFTAVGLGINVLLIATGFSCALLILGTLEGRLILQGRVAAAIAAIVAFALAAGAAGAGIRGILSASADTAAQKAACNDSSGNAPPGTYVDPIPRYAEPAGLTFCPVNLNDGRPVKGRYTLSGAVVGAAPNDKEVALIMQPDPSTCDTKGNPGADGYFLMRRLTFINGLAAWQADGRLPYPESSSIRRNFYYIVAPTAAIDSLQQDNDANLGNPRYGGLVNPPQSFNKVSSFSFTPGSRKDC